MQQDTQWLPNQSCDICKKEKPSNMQFFTLPHQCQCPKPKTDLELLQDEVKSLTKKVNRLIKNQNKQNK